MTGNFSPELAATARCLDNPTSFWEEALYQRFCAGCGRELKIEESEAHHVVREQDCRRAGAPLHHCDDVLLICISPGRVALGCHERHHQRTRVLPTSVLTDRNVAFAARWLQPAGAVEYLRRHYDDSAGDARLLALLEAL